jgi:hypothetical protein
LVTKIKESPVALTDLVIRFYRDVATEGHDELIDELFTSDFVLHGRPGTPDRPGTAPIRGSLAALREAFADLRFDVEDVLDDGDRIAARRPAVVPSPSPAWSSTAPATSGSPSSGSSSTPPPSPRPD